MSVLAPPLEAASRWASDIDTLLLALAALSVVVVGGIGALIVIFAVRYRRGSPASHGAGARRNRVLEAVWIGLPLLIFLGIFVWSAALYRGLHAPPGDALTINVIAKQWMWKAQHQGGQREINELHVPLGRPVKLVMTSQDVIHSLFVPAFRVKQDVLPGRYTSLWFEPTREGVFPLYCAELCGAEHSRMGGRLVVLSPVRYEGWLKSNPGSGSLADRGAKLFRRLGCSGCHGDNATVHAPQLDGIYGRSVPLADGGWVQVDERYIRDAILLPAHEVAAGYAPIMPSFQGQVGEDELLELIAYIRSLEGDQGASR